MTPAQTFVLLLVIGVPTVLSGLVGKRKGRMALGLVLGLVLGLIGLVVIAIIPPTRDELVRRARERQAIEQVARGEPR